MFFGLEVKHNQAKSLTLDKTLKLSQAVLEPSKLNGKKDPVSVYVEYNKKQFILCVLDPSLSWQCPIDLMFEEGSEVKFFLKGNGTIHLTGYEMEDDYDDIPYSCSDDDSEFEEQTIARAIAAKKSLKSPKSKAVESFKSPKSKVNGSPSKPNSTKNTLNGNRLAKPNVFDPSKADTMDEESDDEDYEIDEMEFNDGDDDLDDEEGDDEDDDDDEDGEEEDDDEEIELDSDESMDDDSDE